jgi:hypothetical protein
VLLRCCFGAAGHDEKHLLLARVAALLLAPSSGPQRCRTDRSGRLFPCGFRGLRRRRNRRPLALGPFRDTLAGDHAEADKRVPDPLHLVDEKVETGSHNAEVDFGERPAIFFVFASRFE